MKTRSHTKMCALAMTLGLASGAPTPPKDSCLLTAEPYIPHALDA